jgi:hypothetical protein
MMPTTDVLNTAGSLAYQYPEMKVYIGSGDAAPPDSSPTVFSNVYCSRVVQSASGSRLDYAELTWALTNHLINRTQPANFARMIDVRLPVSPTELKLHRGDYVRESMRLDPTEESLTAQSQMRPYHFGEPATAYNVWHEPLDDVEQIQDDIVFNPTVDGQTRFNRSSESVESPMGPIDLNTIYLWAHPELADATYSQAYNDQTRSEWNMQEAVKSLCYLLNPYQDFIYNPSNSELAAIFTSPTIPIRDIRIPLGTHLPQALDALLIPHGFNWYLNYTTATKPTIKLFKIGSGTQKTLKLQMPGGVLNLTLSNVNKLSIDSNIADSFNQVTVLGDYKRYEVTLPLHAAWSSAVDAYEPYRLAQDGPDYEENQSAWRLWIANEAGDLDTTVSRFGQLPEVPDFWNTAFAWFTPHRRVMEDPITMIPSDPASTSGPTDNRLQRIPILLEYSIDGGINWKPAEDGWSYKVCPDQIGVYFDGHDIPVELHEAGNNHRLRLTGTIASDERLKHTAFKSATNAVNGRVFEKVFIAGDKFQWAERKSGTFGSRFAATDYPADERDDSDAIQSYAEKLRDQNQFADLSCEFRLPGWHDEYKIGDLLTEVDGRELSLNAAPSGSTVQRYVQIVERRFEMGSGGPETVLIVDRGVAQ